MAARTSAFVRTNDFDLRLALSQIPEVGAVDVTDLPFTNVDEMAFCVGTALRMISGHPPSGSQISDLIRQLGERATYAEVIRCLTHLASNSSDSEVRSRAPFVGNVVLYFSLIYGARALDTNANPRNPTPATRRRPRRRPSP